MLFQMQMQFFGDENIFIWWPKNLYWLQPKTLWPRLGYFSDSVPPIALSYKTTKTDISGEEFVQILSLKSEHNFTSQSRIDFAPWQPHIMEILLVIFSTLFGLVLSSSSSFWSSSYQIIMIQTIFVPSHHHCDHLLRNHDDSAVKQCAGEPWTDWGDATIPFVKTTWSEDGGITIVIIL